MKLSVEILWLTDAKFSLRGPFFKGECTFVGVDCDYIDDHDDLIRVIRDDIGNYVEGENFEIVNEEEFWNKLTGDPLENLEKIRKVLRRYFETDDNDNPNKEYDENYSAQAAINDIHSIIGNI